MKKRTTTLLSITVIITLLCSCAALLGRKVLKDCNFSLASFKLKTITVEKIVTEVTIQIDNPNGIDAIMDRFGYSFGFDNDTLFSGKTEQKLTVPKGGSTQLVLPIELHTDKVIKTILNIVNNKLDSVFVKGDVYFSALGYEIGEPVSMAVKKKLNKEAIEKKYKAFLKKAAKDQVEKGLRDGLDSLFK